MHNVHDDDAMIGSSLLSFFFVIFCLHKMISKGEELGENVMPPGRQKGVHAVIYYGQGDG